MAHHDHLLRSLAVVCLVSLLVVCVSPAPGQIQQPPPGGGGDQAAAFGIVCDGTTQTGAQIQNAINTLPSGSRLQLPAGSCLLNQTITVGKPFTLQGTGMNMTTLRQTDNTLPVIHVTSINVMIRELTVTHTGTAVSGGDGVWVQGATGVALQAVTLVDVTASENWRGFVLGCSAYSQAERLWAHYNNSHGFEFLYVDVCGAQWDVVLAIAQTNQGAGFRGNNTALASGIGPWLTETQTFANNGGGYVFTGTATTPINNLRFNSPISSTDNVHGIYLDTYGASHVMLAPWIELTGRNNNIAGSAHTPSTPSLTGHCLEVTPNNGANVTIIGGAYLNCSWSGVALDSTYATLTGGTSGGNGFALDAALARRAGVEVSGSGSLVSGHTFSFPGTSTLTYLQVTASDAVIGLNTYAPDLPAPRTLTALRQRGQVTITDTNTTASVTLTPATPDTNYFVQLTPVESSGGTNAAAYTVTGVAKTTGSWTVTVSGAPGVGNSVTYDWLMYR